MHSKARQKAVDDSKSEVSSSIITGNSGANKSPDSILFWQLPWSVAMICGLSSGAKCLFAKLNFDAWKSNCSRVGTHSQAKTFGVDRVTIRGWLRELEQRDLIKITYEWSCCCYYLDRKFRVGGFIPLLAETMKRRDVGWAYKLVLCSMSYRQAGNDYCWAMQKDLAEYLGLSLRTIQRIIADMKARGEVQIRLRRWNRKYGNKYALTCGAVLGGRIFGANSHTTKSPPLYKKWRLKSYFKALRAKFLSGDLSSRDSRDGFGPEAVFLELVNVGVHEKVARPLAFDDKHPFESVVNAKNNAQILRAAVFKRLDDAGLPRQGFNLAGYVVAALNGARSEGKKVGTTKLFREAGAMLRALKIAKARRGRWRPPSEAEFDRRRRAAKCALGLPA
ncbi:hypothetical protein ES703_12387 [subsurface metagenome]